MCAYLYPQVSKRVRILGADGVRANPVIPDTEIVARTRCSREECECTPCLSLSRCTPVLFMLLLEEKHKASCLRVHVLRSEFCSGVELQTHQPTPRHGDAEERRKDYYLSTRSLRNILKGYGHRFEVATLRRLLEQ
ncbi:hypothetical protein EYF80_044737 [Liparis tanakae]|uniref:Uncharacterized protein n=1 Tax=Liparis tanakae TaxID=230148 RepID=A0A4Z2FV30_9TELE|nr:hypothetical protein EYF80_044737 [Liparis tanakae]